MRSMAAMTLRLDDDESDALRRRAEQEGRSMQQVVHEALREYFERHAVERLLSLAGSFEIEDVSADLRAVDRP
jgi:predicted transcriptional regulator